ncbi:hypothetical protein V1478_002933 [Vespula squamosa]|uniref:Uncharacterized protein n=1 Tax=Vespula squamosa TaxID=30214 RepID=A0ABD2BR83_VESSQ
MDMYITGVRSSLHRYRLAERSIVTRFALTLGIPTAFTFALFYLCSIQSYSYLSKVVSQFVLILTEAFSKKKTMLRDLILFRTNTRMKQCANLLGEDPFFMTKLVSNSVPHFITIPAACSEAGHPEIYSKLVTFDGYSKKDFKLEHATYSTYSIPLLGPEGTAGACSGASTSDQPGKTKLNLKCPSKKLSRSSRR